MTSHPTIVDVASMAAARQASRTAPPTVHRDGFELISREPIVWDVELQSLQNSYMSMSFQDITYHKSTADLAARIAFNRPEILHAFRPITIREVQAALEDATDDPHVAVIILTSNNNNSGYTPAFCAGGDQRVRMSNSITQEEDDEGAATGADRSGRSTTGGGYQDGSETIAKLRVLDLQIQMRRCPKPIMAVVRGYAIGGGHILHMVADLTLACRDTAVFGQTGPRMGSFDAGYGCVQAVSCLGQKRARELWMLCQFYNATQAVDMGLINAAFPSDELDGRVAQWTRRLCMNSPTALAACKAACNAVQDGAAGLSQMGGQLTNLFYGTQEAMEGRNAFLEKRAPQFRSKL
jgi:naphthoate synthase